MRPFVTLFAVFALLLAVGPGGGAHAAGVGLDGVQAQVSAQMDGAGCGGSADEHRPEKQPDAGHRLSCCIGTVCVSAGLPVAAILVTPPADALIDPTVTAALLTGRDVAPPLDPPRRMS